MAALLKDALQPNLVQTLEGNPGPGPWRPVRQHRPWLQFGDGDARGLRLADYVVTEAGFGADLGAEKFFDIKCRKAGLKPAAAVVVATVRALKMHGGVAKHATSSSENVEALRSGLANLGRHVANVRQVRPAGGRGDQPLHRRHRGRDRGGRKPARASRASRRSLCTHWAEGGAGADDLARRGRRPCSTRGEADFQPLYRGRHAAVRDKIKTVARRDLWRRRHRDRRPRDRDAARPMETRRLWPAARLHGQDPVQLLDRSRRARRARPATSCRCARCGSSPAPASSSRSAGRS